MAISVSLDASEESVGTPTGRVILFGTIPTTIPNTIPTMSPPTTHTDTTVTPTKIPTVLPTVPPSPNHTPALPNITLASPDYSLAYDTESNPSEDPSSDHIPPLPAISPFLSSANDTTDSDTPDTPPSPTYALGQPIPYRRPYRYHLNGPLHMLNTRKRVGPLPTHRLVVRHFVDHSSSDYFSLNDSARYSSSDSSSEASSPMTYVPALSPVSGALSHVCIDLIPSPKRIRDSDYLADVEDDSRESSEPSRTHRDGSRSRGIDVRVVAKTVARDKIGTDTRDIVEGGDDRITHPVVLDDRFHDHTVAIPVHRVQVIKGVQREQGRRIIGVDSAVTALIERIAELERENKRLRGTASVESQRVDQLQRGMSRKQRELRQI
ncbi:hypothetical protein Tco_0404166 [Tanacetum coccineum]